ncbi:hypothetical protein DE146DRAFT_258572 [Phaeosphaeria sp. MPI-PUGE-AT-0046c]|nr:hypothetical protein DE146DRAFT_258572 [Phaeosphaeria sp. MPI-PUGE-AT-0046c]
MTRASNDEPARGSSTGRTSRSRRKPATEPNGGFTFIVATQHHEDFQNAANRRTVRSGAMKWHKKYGAPRANAETTTASPSSPAPVLTPSPSSLPGIDSVFVSETSQSDWGLNDLQSCGTLATYANFDNDLQLGASAVRPSYGHAVRADAYSGTVGRVSSYDRTEHHQRLMVHLLISMVDPHHHFGDANNALVAFFRFNNPIISADFLLHEFVDLFATESMMQKWPRMMGRQCKLILSSTLLATMWNDVHDKDRSDSNWTMAVKEEVRALVAEALRATAYDDATLMALLHLLVGELWSLDEQESSSRDFEKLIVTVINRRVEKHHYLSLDVQEIVAAHCYHWAISCEEKSTSVFDAWSPQDLLRDGAVAVPQSPLFRQKEDLATARRSMNCSKFTASILIWMCDLTDLFVAGNKDANAPEIKLEDQGRGSQRLITFHYKANDIRQRLTSLASAYKPGLDTTNDFVYEACRIVALIYVTALIDRSPFSVAARSSKFVSTPSSGSVAKARADRQGSATSPVEALVEVLKNTVTANIWGDMAGIFYWVCAVGAAAARTPAISDGHYRPSLSEERRYLDMHATRAMTILVFEHPTPVLMAQRKLLKIQSIIGSHISKSDEN